MRGRVPTPAALRGMESFPARCGKARNAKTRRRRDRINRQRRSRRYPKRNQTRRFCERPPEVDRWEKGFAFWLRQTIFPALARRENKASKMFPARRCAPKSARSFPSYVRQSRRFSGGDSATGVRFCGIKASCIIRLLVLRKFVAIYHKGAKNISARVMRFRFLCARGRCAKSIRANPRIDPAAIAFRGPKSRFSGRDGFR